MSRTDMGLRMALMKQPCPLRLTLVVLTAVRRTVSKANMNMRHLQSAVLDSGLLNRD